MREGNRVYIIDDLSTGFKRNIPMEAIFYKADVGDRDALCGLDIKSGIDCIYHLAAQSSGEASFDDPLKDIAMNYEATYNVLELARVKRCKRFIFSSSMSVYGQTPKGRYRVSEGSPCNPVSYYGCNKLASEKLIKVFAEKSGMEYTIFRLFSVYGPGQNMLNMKQGMVSIYLAYLMNDRPILVKGSFRRFRDFIYIDDVIEAFLKSEKCRMASGRTLNLGTSTKITVEMLLKTILKVYGKNDFKSWVERRGHTAGDVIGCIADISSLRETVGWRPRYSLEDGVARMKEWLDENS